MEIQEIRYFLALSETLNFTRAAERCNVSQPALTRAIQSLEDKLAGGPLVHRERGNTHLTELGRMMKPYFEHMLAEVEAARAKAKSYGKLADAPLTIGLMCTVGPTLLVDLFAGFKASYPGINLHLKDAAAQTLEDALIKGDMDVAIYCKPDAIDDRFHIMPLFTERFMVAMAPTHPLANRGAISIRDLDGHTYLNRSNCEYLDHLRQLRLAAGARISCPYSSDRDDWIQSMVLAGLGFTYIPEYAVTMPSLVTIPLIEPEVVRTVNLVTVRGRPHAAAVGAFVHEAKRYRWQDVRRRLEQQAA